MSGDDVLALIGTTPEGLQPAEESEMRYTIECIHNAPEVFKSVLKDYGTRSPQEMKDMLAKPDVTVTNHKDKDTMLPVLGKTDEHVRQMFVRR